MFAAGSFLFDCWFWAVVELCWSLRPSFLSLTAALLIVWSLVLSLDPGLAGGFWAVATCWDGRISLFYVVMKVSVLAGERKLVISSGEASWTSCLFWSNCFFAGESDRCFFVFGLDYISACCFVFSLACSTSGLVSGSFFCSDAFTTAVFLFSGLLLFYFAAFLDSVESAWGPINYRCLDIVTAFYDEKLVLSFLACCNSWFCAALMACCCCYSFMYCLSRLPLLVVDSLYCDGAIDESKLLKFIESSLFNGYSRPSMFKSFCIAIIALLCSSVSLAEFCSPGWILSSFSRRIISCSFSISPWFFRSFSLSSAISLSMSFGSNSDYIMLWLLMLWMVLSTSLSLIDYEYISRLLVEVSEGWWTPLVSYI